MPTTPLVPLTLVVGDEELLVARGVSAVVQAGRAADPACEVSDLDAAGLEPGRLDQLLSPSLFGGRQVVVLRGAQDLDKALTDELLRCAATVPGEVSLVVTHAGGQKGKALLAALGKLADATVDAPRLTRPSERRDFVRRELRAGRRPVEEEAVTLLLDAVGTDLRALAAAAGQLLADTEGPVTVEAVGRYHRGRAESSGFAIADKALDGDLGGALELARWGESTGLAPVLVTSALASSLRSVGMVLAADRVPAGQLAAQLGMPPWKVQKTQKQARGWRPESVESALRAVARADGEVKGDAAGSKAYAVERALLAVVGARRGER